MLALTNSDAKLIVVSSSPRDYGNVRIVAKIVEGIAREVEGIGVIHIDVYDYDIKPCIGCVSDDVMLCRYPCIIEDDMKKLYEHVLNSDGIIFVTPIYWYNVPGPLKNFIDRLTVFENAIFTEGKSKLEGKVASFIAIGNDTGSIAVIQNLMIIMNSMGVIIPPWALAYHTSDEDPISNESFILDVANVVRCTVLMIKTLKGFERPSYWYRADSEYRTLVKRLAEKVAKSYLNSILNQLSDPTTL